MVDNASELLRGSIYLYFFSNHRIVWVFPFAIATLQFLILFYFGTTEWYEDQIFAVCTSVAIATVPFCPAEPPGLTIVQKILFGLVLTFHLGAPFFAGLRIMWSSCNARHCGPFFAGLACAAFSLGTYLIGGNFLKKNSSTYVEAAQSATILLFVVAIDSCSKSFFDAFCPLLTESIQESARQNDFPVLPLRMMLGHGHLSAASEDVDHPDHEDHLDDDDTKDKDLDDDEETEEELVPREIDQGNVDRTFTAQSNIDHVPDLNDDRDDGASCEEAEGVSLEAINLEAGAARGPGIMAPLDPISAPDRSSAA